MSIEWCNECGNKIDWDKNDYCVNCFENKEEK